MYERIRETINERDLLARHLGIMVEELGKGYARATMPLDERHHNGMGNVHGGASFALADLACAGVAHADNVATVNVSSSINYVAAGTAGPLTAVGKLISESRRICTVEVTVTDGNGTLIAVFNSTGYRTGKPYLMPGA